MIIVITCSSPKMGLVLNQVEGVPTWVAFDLPMDNNSYEFLGDTSFLVPIINLAFSTYKSSRLLDPRLTTGFNSEKLLQVSCAIDEAKSRIIVATGDSWIDLYTDAMRPSLLPESGSSASFWRKTCAGLKDYLRNSPLVSESNRNLCQQLENLDE